MSRLAPIAVLVKNERGVLSRVSGLFARRGFNIASLAVGDTENPAYSRITLVAEVDDASREQLIKQLYRLVAVIEVADLSKESLVERGLALVKVKASQETRHQLVELAQIFRAAINHIDHDSMILEVAGDRGKVAAMIDMLAPHGILEMARTGQIALGRESILKRETRNLPLADEQTAQGGIYNYYQTADGQEGVFGNER